MDEPLKSNQKTEVIEIYSSLNIPERLSWNFLSINKNLFFDPVLSKHRSFLITVVGS